MTNGLSSLAGRRVVVTRSAEQAGEMEALLRDRGAEPLAYPCIAIAAPADTGPLDGALRDLAAGRFDWLVLTSSNAVTVLAERLHILAIDSLSASGAAVAVIGSATAQAVERDLGLPVDLFPETFVAEALAADLLTQLASGGRVLVCQADIARPVLVETLAAGGAAVTSVVAYRTVRGSGGVDLPVLLRSGQVDAVTLTSSSTVRNLLARLEAEGGCVDDLAGVCLACVGPITAETARKLGLTVQVVPQEHTIAALVNTLEAYFAQ